MRGGAFELLDLLPIILFVVFSIGLSIYGTTRVNTRVHTLLNDLPNSPTSDINPIFQKLNDSNDTLENTITFVIFGLMLVSLVFSYLVRHHPLFIVAAIFILVLTIIVATQVKTAAEKIYANLPELQNYMTNASFFWSHFVEIITVWGLLNIVMMFLGAVKLQEGGV